jgi:hypothetical protein
VSEETEDKNLEDQDVQKRIFLVVVDDTDEMPVALRYASYRARTTGGLVALLTTLEKEDFGHWAAVDDLIEDEQREQAEKMMARFADTVQQITGQPPILHIRQGAVRDALFSLIEEEPSISILVLAAGTSGRNPGPLISALTGKLYNRLEIPITIVPGTLTDEDMRALT